MATTILKWLSGTLTTVLNTGATLASNALALSAEITWSETDYLAGEIEFAGTYDPRFNLDGLSTPVVTPPAYGLAGIAKETFTGDGDVSYWNNYVGVTQVAVTQMGGQGVFVDPRLDVSVIRTPDLVHGKLPALLAYQ